MEKIEYLITRENYDRKNIINKSDKIINDSDLNILESQGATYELLNELGVPVFKYKTQITIHGKFPDLQQTHHFGYKNIFQNKNLSIGVKYTAIDRLKKRKIFNVLNQLYGWSITNNSTEYSICKCSERFTTKSEYINLLPAFKKECENINQKLFFGTCDVYLQPSYFCYYLVLRLNIGSIAENNVDDLILNITGKSFEENNKLIEEKRIAYEAKLEEENKERERIKLEQIELYRPYKEQADEMLISAGYVLEEVNIYNGLIYPVPVVNSESFEIRFKLYKIFKTKSQKQFRYLTSKVDSLNDIDNAQFDGMERKTLKTKVTIWHKNLSKVVLPEQKNIISESKDITIVNYSDKSFAIIGNTKPIKDKLKELGGRFNFHLTCGPGWIFPITKKQNILSELKMN